MAPFAKSMFLTWVFGLLAFVLLVPAAIWSVIFVLRLMLTVLYAISGNAPAGFEGVF